MKLARTWLAPAALLGSFLLVAWPAAAEERSDFSGSWRINERLSEDPQAKMREAMRKRGGPGGGMGRGGMGRGGMGGGGRGGTGRGGMDPGPGGGPRGGMTEDREDMRRHMQALREGFQEMEIIHEDPVLTLRYADGRERVLHTDGRKQTREAGIGDVETRAKWKKGKLVVKATKEEGTRVTETFEYGPEADFLYVTVNVQEAGPAPEFTFRRVYERP